MLMLDLFAGLGGASQSMRDRGWTVLRVDNQIRFHPDIAVDITHWTYTGPRPDLIWASPPCTEFSRTIMPWLPSNTPDLSLVKATLRIVQQTNPRFWVLENVKGSVKWITPLAGPPALTYNPWYFWGHFPPPPLPPNRPKKQAYPGTMPALRAKIPYTISAAFATAIEHQDQLL